MYQKKGNHVHMRYWIHYLNTTQKEDQYGNQCICNQSIETMPSSQEMETEERRQMPISKVEH